MKNNTHHQEDIPVLSKMPGTEDLGATVPKEKLKKKDAARALQTYFRNNYKTHISLSALADRKSHIMIRLNSLLISILIVFFKEILSLTPLAIFAGVTFLITTLISLVFAALAAKPSVTKILTPESSFEETQRNIFFYGNFISLKIDKYVEAVESILNSPELIYNNMIRDLYFLGKVLDRKFRLLNYSYSVFIGGLIITVIAFLIAVHIM